MSIRKVLNMGDPRLLQVSEPILNKELGESSLATILEDMFDTMKCLDGAGLAAPQIGIFKRIVIFGVDKNPRYPNAEQVPMTVLINPEIEIVNDAKEGGWEGCLSVPGLRGWVPRATYIRYTGIDENGNRISREASDFHARVVQHEVDHLDGILYPMRIEDMTKFGFEQEISGQM